MTSISMPADQAAEVDSARLFHALSDQTRLAIVNRLRSGELCVCDLMRLLQAAQSRLSFHLRVLRDAGLVRDRRDGRWVYYALRPEAFAMLSNTVRSLRPKRSGLPSGLTEAYNN